MNSFYLSKNMLKYYVKILIVGSWTPLKQHWDWNLCSRWKTAYICAYMHASNPCMQVFARKSKLLIVWRDEWNYSPPSAQMCFNIAFQFLMLGTEMKIAFAALVGNITKSLSFCHSTFLLDSPPHFSPFLLQIKSIFIHPFTLNLTLSHCQNALHSNKWTRCVYVCVREIESMCVCYLPPPGCPEE